VLTRAADEVRALGRLLGIPAPLVQRHPFPGPGLAIRILGPVTREQVKILQHADAIYLEEIRAAGLYDEIAQAFAVLLPVRAVGVMGDKRTYEQVIALRAVTSEDFMTADWCVPARVWWCAGLTSAQVRVPAGRAPQNLVADHERGRGREPGHVRHLVQAARGACAGARARADADAGCGRRSSGCERQWRERVREARGCAACGYAVQYRER
jgi:hypothetical protein